MNTDKLAKRDTPLTMCSLGPWWNTGVFVCSTCSDTPQADKLHGGVERWVEMSEAQTRECDDVVAFSSGPLYCMVCGRYALLDGAACTQCGSEQGECDCAIQRAAADAAAAVLEQRAIAPEIAGLQASMRNAAHQRFPLPHRFIIRDNGSSVIVFDSITHESITVKLCDLQGFGQAIMWREKLDVVESGE
jgi:hypothetical protein